MPMTAAPPAPGVRRRRSPRRYLDGPKLLGARLRSGLSQGELAEKAGVGDQSRISAWESGSRGTSLANVHALAVALGLKPEGLMPDETLAAARIKTATGKKAIAAGRDSEGAAA